MFLHQLCASYSVKVRLYCQGKSIVKHLCAIAVWLRWALEACSFDWLWTSADLVASLASFSSASRDRSPLLLSVGQGFLPQPQSFLVCISYNSLCLLYSIDWNRFHVYDIFFFSATWKHSSLFLWHCTICCLCAGLRSGPSLNFCDCIVFLKPCISSVC